MPFEPHEKARFLLDQAIAQGISPDDQRWLDLHLEACTECNRYAELSARAVRALDGFAFDLDPEAALRVQNAVRARAERLRAAEANARSLFIGTLVAAFLVTAGSILAWQPVAWLAAHWSLPSPAWQIGFAVFWLLPSLLLAAVPLFRNWLRRDEPDKEGETV